MSVLVIVGCFALFVAAVLVLLGGVAIVATAAAKPRTARFYAWRNERADAYADAIASGEAAARAAADRAALALGCAQALREAVAADPACSPWALGCWEAGMAAMPFTPVAAGLSEPLALAACLLYCLDLEADRLNSATPRRGWEAAHQITIPAGRFHDSGLMEAIGGFGHLMAHRQAGIADLDGPCTCCEPVTCPFCGIGVYDQTIIGCQSCTGPGEFTRTAPAWWTGGARLPKRVAPDPRLHRANLADIEARHRDRAATTR